jgi:hypothetical protein
MEGLMATDLVDATERAIRAAEHLTDMDLGAVEALRALARKIDAWDQIVDWAIDDASERDGARPTVPQNDNVSISAYAKLSDQLGLTPIGRKALALKKEAESAKSAKLTALRGGKAAG